MKNIRSTNDPLIQLLQMPLLLKLNHNIIYLQTIKITIPRGDKNEQHY